MITFIRSLNFNKICIFLFVFVYIGLYYQEYIPIILCSYILLFLAFAYNVVRRRNIIYKKYVVICFVFCIYSLFSALWAVSFDDSYNSAIQLCKSSLVAVCFITLIDSKENFKWALFALSLSGIVYAFLYLQNVDISSLSNRRITTEGNNEFLPNVNTVGLIVCFSFSYFIYKYFLNKKRIFLIFAGLAFVITSVLGSRKSIISLFIAILLMSLKLPKAAKVKIVFLLIVLLTLLFLYIPTEYLHFISERLAHLNFFSSQLNVIDASDEERFHMMEYGIIYCSESPIIGKGYYSFSQLFRIDYGVAMYSHNNFIEAFVGGGIIGFVLYYNLYYLIVKRVSLKNIQFDNRFLILILLAILLFNHIGIVVLQDRFTWLLLAILYAGSSFYRYRLL